MKIAKGYDLRISAFCPCKNILFFYRINSILVTGMAGIHRRICVHLPVFGLSARKQGPRTLMTNTPLLPPFPVLRVGLFLFY